MLSSNIPNFIEFWAAINKKPKIILKKNNKQKNQNNNWDCNNFNQNNLYNKDLNNYFHFPKSNCIIK